MTTRGKRRLRRKHKRYMKQMKNMGKGRGESDVEQEGSSNGVCLIFTSEPEAVQLSRSVRVEGLDKDRKIEFSLIVRGNECDKLSGIQLHKSKHVSLLFDNYLKPGKKDFSWKSMSRIMRVLKPEIIVYFGQNQVTPPMPNTVESILARYFSPSPPTKRETMAYELLRLCTLHDFPKTTGQSCIRLAQAAFFYEGKDDEVTCFSCSIQICGWQPQDIPLDRHRETSPNCLFIKGQNSGNVPICHTGSNRGNYVPICHTGSNRESPRQTSNSEEGAAAGLTVSAEKVSVKGSKRGSGEDSGLGTDSCVAQNSNLSVPQNSGASNTSGYVSQSSGSSNTSNSQTYITSSGSLSMTGILDSQTPNQYTVTSTNRNRAHYPEYVLVNDRLRSFDRGWPDYVSQTPQMMVESGFFFAGYEDCVRCFQCGIGLRNWEPPDSPHVEHARWSPKCPFLLSVKGQDFINLVLDAVAQLALRNEQSANTPPHTESNPGKAVLLQQTSQQRSTATRNPVTTGSSAQTDATGSSVRSLSQPSRSTDTTQQDAIETEVAKNVLKKGFSENEVRRAIEKIVKTDGWKSVTEDRIQKTILEEKQKESKTSSGLNGGAEKQTTTLSSEVMELKKKNREMREMTICKICLEEEVSIAFLPCGHLVACAQCAPALSRCAVCRKPITGTICAHLDV